jgi:hypothetical protein
MYYKYSMKKKKYQDQNYTHDYLVNLKKQVNANWICIIIICNLVYLVEWSEMISWTTQKCKQKVWQKKTAIDFIQR